jgi:group I intron endonuclease
MVKLELKPEWNKDGAPSNHYLRLIKNKPGIFMFTSNITKKRFIGESSNLLKRFLNYSSKSWLEKKQNSMIQKAMRKQGLHNFSISIIEYCKTSQLRSKKQYFINVLKPQLNIRKSICKPDKTPA